MLREQPSLSAWGRPAGWVPRPQVGRRPRLADPVERLVRSHDPRRGLRTRPDHRLSPVKCGEDSANNPLPGPPVVVKGQIEERQHRVIDLVRVERHPRTLPDLRKLRWGSWPHAYTRVEAVHA